MGQFCCWVSTFIVNVWCERLTFVYQIYCTFIDYLQQKEQEKEIQEKEEEGDRVQCERIGEGGGANVVREDR